MMDELCLENDEIVIFKEVGMARGDISAVYTDVLVLTNKKIVYLNKSVFGNTKQIYHFPLEQIKIVNAVPQVKEGKLSNGISCLDIYFSDGIEHFRFREKNKQKIINWISEIYKLFNLHYVSESQNKKGILSDLDDYGLESFKEVGREIATAFGLNVNGKKSVTRKDGIQSKANCMQRKRCQTCGNSVEEDSRFCSNCGSRIGLSNQELDIYSKFCPNCGKKLRSDIRFCTECGTEIEK